MTQCSSRDRNRGDKLCAGLTLVLPRNAILQASSAFRLTVEYKNVYLLEMWRG